MNEPRANRSEARRLELPGLVTLEDGRHITAEIVFLPPGTDVLRSGGAVEIDARDFVVDPPWSAPLLWVRFPEKGDRFHALGAPGSKALSRFLADVGVPRGDRGRVPLVFAGDELVRLGQLDLGESRASELERKHRALREAGLAPRWHFLGHLQGNKVRRVVAIATSIHSIDSLRLLDAVDRAAGELGARPEVWIQVKLSSEPTKTGLDRRELDQAFERAAGSAHLRLAGLMTLAPLATDAGPAETEASARRVFRELHGLARQVGMRDALAPRRVRTSMGMSSDFEWAVEEGSDLVRVGSRLFEG